MKLVIDIDTRGKPIEGDLIMYHNEKWQLVTHENCFINEDKKIIDVLKDNEKMRNELANMKNDLKVMAKAIKGARK